MAEIYPRLSDDELRRLPSQGEARFYRACKDHLGERHLVLYSVPYVRPGRRGDHIDGEADFVVFDERGGFVVVEVKGGGVSFDPMSGTWTSEDRRGARHAIKDPFRQATSQKHEVLRRLQEHPRWKSAGCGYVPAAHAVFFPDLDDVDALVSPQRPREILAGRRDLTDLEAWVEGVSAYWCGDPPGRLGRAGMDIVKDVFCKPIEVRPLLATQLRQEEERRIRLTEEQARMLRGLGLRRRAVIAGGAGTGKTLLALQKARQLADDGLRTLLLCYNRPLADHLKRVVGSHPHLLPMTFHQLCDWRIRQVRERTGRDLLQEASSAYPNDDLFDTQMPYALALAAELEDPFDAIVVDEGQDFGDDFWLPLELSLQDESEGLLYVFYDPNQAVYARSSTLPIQEPPFLLTLNCRNTRPIHQAAYRHFSGEKTDPPDIEGAPVESICAPSLDAQARRIHALLVRLLHEEGVSPDDTVVLVADAARKGEYYAALEEKPLPKQASFAIETHGVAGTVRVDTAHRFKGLEAAVVVLWGLDGLDPAGHQRTLYVGLSRAKSRLYVAGSEAACAIHSC